MLVLALVVTATGWVVQARLGIEPSWLVSLTNVTGSAIVAAACLLGITIAAGQHTKSAGLLLAAALPVGLAIDWLTTALVPFGQFFLNGAGFTIGLLLCSVALIRLGRTAHTVRVTYTPAPAGADA